MKKYNLKAIGTLVWCIAGTTLTKESTPPSGGILLPEELQRKMNTVTIFIHGTLPPKPLLRIPMVNKFVGYPKGLHPLANITEEFRLASLARILCEEDPELFNKDFFYLFGWSGRLSINKRRKAAKDLAHSLSLLKQRYTSEGISVSFRLITHSHGGNVALHLSEFFTATPPFTIDELILLACPVQKKTESYINHPLFSSIISLYSHLDVAQRIDPQGIDNFLESVHSKGLKFTVSHLESIGPFFSSRHFKPTPHLRQVYVKFPSRGLLHNDFISEPYMRSLPTFMRSMKTVFKEKPYQEELTYVIPSK
ncbi:hypothetical protein H0W26_02785 [Candidatus Dependentiae bacterium]|nr:hypothetical protein [Candidatus Dependentiae bacterium]